MIKRLFVAIVALLLSFNAAAEWVDRGVDVWSSVGRLYNFRLVMMRHTDGDILTYLSDCRSRQTIGVSIYDSVSRKEVRTDDTTWFVIRPNTNAFGFTEYACEQNPEQPQGQWIDRPHEKNWQWSYVGALTNFRITMIHVKKETLILLVDCKGGWMRVVAKVHPGDVDELVSHNKWSIWVTEQLNQSYLSTYACKQ